VIYKVGLLWFRGEMMMLEAQAWEGYEGVW